MCLLSHNTEENLGIERQNTLCHDERHFPLKPLILIHLNETEYVMTFSCWEVNYVWLQNLSRHT